VEIAQQREPCRRSWVNGQAVGNSHGAKSDKIMADMMSLEVLVRDTFPREERLEETLGSMCADEGERDRAIGTACENPCPGQKLLTDRKVGVCHRYWRDGSCRG
jgi:hypothetical protein